CSIHSFPTRRSSDLDIAISSIKINEPEIHYAQFFEKPKDSISSRPENQKNIVIKSFEIEGGKLYFSDSQDKKNKIIEVDNVDVRDRKSTRLNSSHVK